MLVVGGLGEGAGWQVPARQRCRILNELHPVDGVFLGKGRDARSQLSRPSHPLRFYSLDGELKVEAAGSVRLLKRSDRLLASQQITQTPRSCESTLKCRQQH